MQDLEIDHFGLRNLYRYWLESVRPVARPELDDINAPGIGFTSNNILIVEVEHEPRRYACRTIGINIAFRQQLDSTGFYLDQLPFPELRDRLRGYYDAVVESARPLLARCDETLDGHKYSYQMLMLPCGQDQVRLILVGVTFGS